MMNQLSDADVLKLLNIRKKLVAEGQQKRSEESKVMFSKYSSLLRNTLPMRDSESKRAPDNRAGRVRILFIIVIFIIMFILIFRKPATT